MHFASSKIVHTVSVIWKSPQEVHGEQTRSVTLLRAVDSYDSPSTHSFAHGVQLDTSPPADHVSEAYRSARKAMFKGTGFRHELQDPLPGGSVRVAYNTDCLKRSCELSFCYIKYMCRVDNCVLKLYTRQLFPSC